MFKRVIFYLTDSKVYHIIPGGEYDYDKYRTLCGFHYRRVKRPNLYYDAKLGTHYFEQDGELVYSRRLCKRCTERLNQAEKIPFNLEFLAISPLRNLAVDFSAKAPIAVIVGAKGSGKTYTFLQTTLRQDWKTFVANVIGTDTAVSAHIAPILQSRNLGDNAKSIVENTRNRTLEYLDLDGPLDTALLVDHVRNGLDQNLHEGQWRERWLDIIAWGIGFETNQDGAGQNLVQSLRDQRKSIVAIFDGLEDIFQNLTSDTGQQVALRSLLQDVPEWLGQQPGRPVGLLVFVRQDMLLNAVIQNPGQLLARYEPYALKWDSEEALRLVAWISLRADKSVDLRTEQLQDIDAPGLVGQAQTKEGDKA